MGNIGIYISNYGVCDVDITNILSGNPGIGGTQYEMFLLAILLSKSKKFNTTIFLDKKQKGLEMGNIICLKEQKEVVSNCNNLGIDILILRAMSCFDFIDNLSKTKVIYWVHNFIDYKSAVSLSSSKTVYKVVFVSKQHYDLYLDLSVIKKSDYVFNCVQTIKRNIHQQEKDNIVVFTGNLVPYNKLDVVTKMWPEILKKVPDAKLYVIGSGQNGNRTIQLGKEGIIADGYENIVLAPLKKNKCEDSVVFWGNKGIEKDEIIRQAKVAVAPCKIETFCISAVEYILDNVPVVAIKKAGLIDVVKDKQTGLLCQTYRGMKKTLIALLTNKKKITITEDAKNYIYENFSYTSFLSKWTNIINDTLACNKQNQYKASKPLSENLKWAGVIINKLKKIFPLPDKISRLGIRSLKK